MVQGKGSITGCDLGGVTFTIIHKPSMPHLEAGLPLGREGLWKVCLCVFASIGLWKVCLSVLEGCVCMCV